MEKNEFRVAPSPARQRMAARLSIGFVSLFLILLTSLHFLEPQYDPSWRLISEYEIGRYGWLMSLAFFSLGGACIALPVAIRPSLHTRGGRVGGGSLMLIGVALLGAGVFISDPYSQVVPSRTGLLHDVCGVVVILGFPVVATILGRSLAREETWAAVARRMQCAAALVWIGLLSFFLSMVLFQALTEPGGSGIGPRILDGWQNRFMMVTYCIWLLVVAGRVSVGPS